MRKTNNILTAGAMLIASFVNAQTSIEANNPKIQYIGRIDFSNPLEPTFAFPGVAVKAKFDGTSISAHIIEYGSGGESTTNYLNVIIDGGAPTSLKLDKAKTTYSLANGLSNGTHTVELFKRTEASVGKVAFRGFILDQGKDLLDPDALPSRRIEFIGNSITCGYGNESSAYPPLSGFTSANENNYKAWGAVTSRNLYAQYMCTAYSGRGLVRNNTGSTIGTAPQFYNRIFPDQTSSKWNHQNYIPHVVVINLGTNDFAAEILDPSYTVDKAVFQTTYKNFIASIRSHYPAAVIICAVGVMMSDYYPTGGRHWTRIQEYVSSMVTDIRNSGDADVFYFKMEPQSAPYGEDWHPTSATALQMANSLTDFINKNVNWNQLITSVERETQSNTSKVVVFPNPFSRNLNVEIVSAQNYPIELKVFDYSGNIKETKTINTNTLFTLGENLSNGIYFIESNENGNRTITKVLKTE